MTAGLLDKYDRARRKQEKETKKVTEKQQEYPYLARTRVMYLRDEDGKPTGVMVAVETDSENMGEVVLRFGMVRYHPTKELLPFTKRKAKEIAFDRAAKCSYRLPLTKGNYSDFKPSRVHTIPEQLERPVRFFMAQAMERLKIFRFENLYDPIAGHTVNA